MNRKTLLALVVFVLLGGAAYYLSSRPPKGQRVGERPRPLAPLDKGKIQQIALKAKGKQTVLARTGETWRVKAPVDYPADKYATDTLVDKLAQLSFGDVVTQQKSKHAEYEVNDKAGVLVTVRSGEKDQLANFYLGKVIDGHTMFRSADSDDVYQVVGSLRNAFDKELKYWRDRTIIKVKRDEIRSIESITDAGTSRLTRKDAKGPWTVAKSPLPIDKLDDNALSSFLSTLSSLSAYEFADDAIAEKTGLDQPKATVSVELADGSRRVLLVGNHAGDDYWVKRQDRDQVFVIKKYSANNLVRRPIDWRDKTILEFKADQLIELKVTRLGDGRPRSVTFTREGDDWLAGGKKAKDQAKLKGAADQLAKLKASGFARQSAAELGMDKASCRVELRLKGGQRHQLQVGSKDQDGFYGVTRDRDAEIFTLRKYALDKFCLDPKDF